VRDLLTLSYDDGSRGENRDVFPKSSNESICDGRDLV